MERFFDRRRIEWRVSIALWASFAIIANTAQGSVVNDLLPAVVGVGLLFLLHLAWALRFHSRAAEANRDQGIDLEISIRRELGLPPPTTKTYSHAIAHVWPPFVTLVLGLGLVWILAVTGGP